MATVFETANEDALDAEFTVVASPQRLIVFTVTDSQIAELKSRAELVDFSTKAGYADGVKVIAVSRGGRGEVKRTIAALNEDAKTWIAQVKAKGGQIEQCLFDIEEDRKSVV